MRETSERDTARRTVAFFASVIKSGESWSAACQDAYDATFRPLSEETEPRFCDRCGHGADIHVVQPSGVTTCAACSCLIPAPLSSSHRSVVVPCLGGTFSFPTEPWICHGCGQRNGEGITIPPNCSRCGLTHMARAYPHVDRNGQVVTAPAPLSSVAAGEPQHITDTEPVTGLTVRKCRGHWHVTRDGEDLSVPGDPFLTAEAALEAVARLNAEEAAEDPPTNSTCDCSSCRARREYAYSTTCCPGGLSHGALCICSSGLSYEPPPSVSVPREELERARELLNTAWGNREQMREIRVLLDKWRTP